MINLLLIRDGVVNVCIYILVKGEKEKKKKKTRIKLEYS